MSNYQHIDPSVIAENMMHNTELIKQFVATYLQQIPRDLQQLKNAVIARKHTETANKAHHIKPTMAYVGATVLKQKFQDIETSAKNGVDFEQISKQVEAMEKGCAMLLEEIKHYLTTL